MLITPAMASDPYCADAPSRSTSILLIAAAGMVFKSVPTEPRPTEPFTFTKDDACLLFPLINTNTWSTPKPRNEAGSIWSLPSAIVCWFDEKEGAT